mgnify:CR=1 FL=1
MALRLGDGVEQLPGIGPARAKSLEKLGLATVEDLLRYFPRDYEDRRRFSTVAAAPVDLPVCLELLVAPPLPHPQGAGAGEGPPGGRYRQRHRHLL